MGARMAAGSLPRHSPTQTQALNLIVSGQQLKIPAVLFCVDVKFTTLMVRGLHCCLGPVLACCQGKESLGV